MYQLSALAEKDITSILDYSAKNFGYEIMLEYFNSLKNCLNILEKNIELGINISHIRKGYRCFYHRSHVIYYKKYQSSILVVRILHKSMDVSR